MGWGKDSYDFAFRVHERSVSGEAAMGDLSFVLLVEVVGESGGDLLSINDADALSPFLPSTEH